MINKIKEKYKLNNLKLSKELIIYLITIILSIVFIICGNLICSEKLSSIENENTEHYERAEVTKVIETIVDEHHFEGSIKSEGSKQIRFNAKIKGGEYKGKTVEAVQNIDAMYLYKPKEVSKGDRVLITLFEGVDENEWYYASADTSFSSTILVLMFFILILIIGKRKGFDTLVSLVFTVLAIFLVYIPGILKGMNIYILTIVIATFIIFMSLIILNGISKKTICAILGNIGGIIAAGILAFVCNKVFMITGLADEATQFLALYNEGNPIDMKALLWGGILIGSLGAIMDVAMSIASAMCELDYTMKDKNIKNMIISGMNIGKDAIGTMTNTLILAYIGSSIANVLLLIAYNKNLIYLFNMETVLIDIIQAVVGRMGILIAVPITVIASGYIFNMTEYKNSKYEQITLKEDEDYFA